MCVHIICFRWVSACVCLCRTHCLSYNFGWLFCWMLQWICVNIQACTAERTSEGTRLRADKYIFKTGIPFDRSTEHEGEEEWEAEEATKTMKKKKTKKHAEEHLEEESISRRLTGFGWRWSRACWWTVRSVNGRVGRLVGLARSGCLCVIRIYDHQSDRSHL